MKTHTKVMVCRYCGSHNILRDAWARWDYTRQEWKLSQVFDEAYCQACDGPSKTEAIDIIRMETTHENN